MVHQMGKQYVVVLSIICYQLGSRMSWNCCSNKNKIATTKRILTVPTTKCQQRNASWRFGFESLRCRNSNSAAGRRKEYFERGLESIFHCRSIFSTDSSTFYHSRLNRTSTSQHGWYLPHVVRISLESVPTWKKTNRLRYGTIWYLVAVLRRHHPLVASLQYQKCTLCAIYAFPVQQPTPSNNSNIHYCCNYCTNKMQCLMYVKLKM